MTLRDWIALQHMGQRVRDTSLSYMDHLDFVANTVSPLIALGYEIGLCHDLFEETHVTPEQLTEALTGLKYSVDDARSITECVIELTDVYTKQAFPDLKKKERKQMEADRLSTISPSSQTVKYADLLYNSRWVLAHQSKSKAYQYLQKKRALLLTMERGDPGLRNRVFEIISMAILELKKGEV